MPLDRSIEILRTVADSDGPLNFTELRDRVALPKATAHRLLSELVQHELLALDSETARYRLGNLFLRLAFRAWESSDVRRVAEPHLQMLRRTVEETIHLAVTEGEAVTYIDKLDGRKHMRIFSAIGKRAPLHCTGVGKAILGALSEEDRNSFLENFPLEGYTPNTLTTREALDASTSELVSNGYVCDMEEHEIGVRCVAAAILNFRNEPVASLSITGATTQMGLDRLRKLGPVALKAAVNISAEMGCLQYPFPAHRSRSVVGV